MRPVEARPPWTALWGSGASPCQTACIAAPCPQVTPPSVLLCSAPVAKGLLCCHTLYAQASCQALVLGLSTYSWAVADSA